MNNLIEIVMAPAMVVIYLLLLNLIGDRILTDRALAKQQLVNSPAIAGLTPLDLTEDEAVEIWATPTLEKLAVGLPLLASAILLFAGVDFEGNPLSVDSLKSWIAGTLGVATWCGGFFQLLSGQHTRTALMPQSKVQLNRTRRKVVAVALLVGAAFCGLVWLLHIAFA